MQEVPNRRSFKVLCAGAPILFLGALFAAACAAAPSATAAFSATVVAIENKGSDTVVNPALAWAEQAASIESRLDRATTFLTSKGYVADWEPTAAGPLLHTNNCPYGGLASTHPELCQMDLDLVTKVTGSEVRRVCHATYGDTTCSYLIMPVLGAIPIAV